MTIKGSLQASIPMVKAFLTQNFPVENGRKICFFGEKIGSKYKILFSGPPKPHPCAKPRHLTYWSWKSVQGSWL